MKIRLLIAALMVAIATSLSACSMPSWLVEKQPDLSPRYSGTVLEAVDQNAHYGSSYKAILVQFEDGSIRSLTCSNGWAGNDVCPFLKPTDKISFNLKMTDYIIGANEETDSIRNIVRLSTTEK